MGEYKDIMDSTQRKQLVWFGDVNRIENDGLRRKVFRMSELQSYKRDQGAVGRTELKRR